MSDSDRPEMPAEERPPAVLGEVPGGPRDTQLGAPTVPPAAPRPRRKPAATPEERPALPRGALVALRRSGGLAFRTREVTVYRDGRVTYDANGPGGQRAQAVWLLGADELEALRRELEAIDWAALRFAHARQSPDAYAYELVARVGRRLRRMEVAEGAIPQAVEPLVRRLASYAPPAEP
ncbi:MAG TPA: hypothetical protein VNL77_07925 [Roseiflexaceae bacterium]|nr:hypothetical protein [Roseiflexaceae bacterium]